MPEATVELPRRCFISHAYEDAAQRDQLIATLPPHVEPVVFPPIRVRPDQLVSNVLIEALLDCDGLIYLDGNRSADSFWVAFERDYALRAGKRVFAAGSDGRLTPHIGAALDLATFASYHRDDGAQVRTIARFLRNERHFDLWVDADALKPGQDFSSQIATSLRERLLRGGYVVVFWSHAARQSQYVEREIASAIRDTDRADDRVLFALLDDTPLEAFWPNQDPGVQVFGDAERGEKNRWDDLVVRLYWLIHRNSQHVT